MTMRTSTRVCLCAALGTLLVACGRKEEAAAPVVPVQVAPAIRGSIRQIVTADAVLELGLESGSPATAVVKSTSIMVER